MASRMKLRTPGIIFAWLILFNFVGLQSARADEAIEFKNIIAQQIEAFQTNDNATAFNFASDTIRQHFKSADRFIRMVQIKYDPVYRPRWYKFDQFEILGGIPTQSVIIQSSQGLYWLALYEFELQENNDWKIRGVSLRELVGAGA